MAKKGESVLLDWLRAHVGHTGEGCLIWPFGRNEKGYGQVQYEGRIQKAHRVMCIFAKGEPPEPRFNAAHSCHKGHEGCVHPQHLDWKTPSENTQESAVFRRGEALPRRLTIEQVEAIRASDKTHAKLAAEFGVAVNTIGKIIRREIWVKPRSKLTKEQINRIRLGTEPVSGLVKEFGLSVTQLNRIRAGTTHRGVECP